MSLLMKALQNAAKDREDKNPTDPGSQTQSEESKELRLEPMDPSVRNGTSGPGPETPGDEPRERRRATPRQAQTVLRAGSASAAAARSPGFMDWIARRPLVAFSTAAGLFAIGYGIYLYVQITNPGLFVARPVAAPPPPAAPQPPLATAPASVPQPPVPQPSLSSALPPAGAPVPPPPAAGAVPAPSAAAPASPAPPVAPAPTAGSTGIATAPAPSGVITAPVPAPAMERAPMKAAPAPTISSQASAAPTRVTPAAPAPSGISAAAPLTAASPSVTSEPQWSAPSGAGATPRESASRPRVAAPRATATQPAARAPAENSPTAAQVDASVMGAYQAFEKGQLDEAERLYRQALAADPRSIDAMLGLASTLTQQNRSNAATPLYLRVLELDPRNAYAQAGLFNIGGRADPAAAEARLKQLIAREPSAYLYFSLGNLYSEQRQWAPAQSAYFQAFNLAPDNPDYAFNLAVGLEHLSQPKLALEYYRKAVVLAQARGHAQFAIAPVQTRIRNLEATFAEQP